MRTSLIAASLLVAVTLTAQAQQDIPPFSSFVTDPALMLDPAVVVPIENMLEQLADGGGARIAVLSVVDLQGEPAGQYALRALYEWRGGDGATQSALLLMAPDGVAALATGSELLPRMSQAEAQAVLIEHLLPTIVQSGMTPAVIAAAQAVMVNLLTEEGGPTGDAFVVVARITADGNPELLDTEVVDNPATEPDSATISLNPERWINEMTMALSLAASAAVHDPAAFLLQAQGELNALPAVLDAASSPPTAPEQVVIRLVLLVASLVLVVFAWRVTRSLAVLLGVVGILAGLWVWQLSSFAALALCVMLLGVLFLPLLRLARALAARAARRDLDVRGGNTVGPSQSYQQWLVAQQTKPGQAPRKAVVVEAPKPKVSAPAPTPAPQPASGRLASGLIDNRSVPSKGAAAGVGTKLAGDRERLHKAGVSTPAIDQLLRSRPVLDGLSKNKLQTIAIGSFIALVVFGPVVLVPLIIGGVIWGRSLWAQVKPANLSSGEFLKQVAKEAEAAAKLPRS